MIWADLRILVLDTGRVWWRLLPQLLTVYLLGWLGTELAQRLAITAGEWNSWAGLAIFSFSFLAQLVAIVVMLQLVGQDLGVRQLIPDAELVSDDRDSSLTRLVSLTLLPFLGIYAVFGDVSERAAQLAYEQLFRSGVVTDQPSILGTLNQAAVEHPWWFLAGLVTIYLLRRGLDAWHERSGIRALGLTVALVETFFMLVVIMGGVRIWQQAKLWLADRAFMAWLDSWWQHLLDALSVISIHLPVIVTRMVGFLADEVWPLLWEALVQPVVWLAVAALVFGTQVLSLAELWRKGQPYLAKVPGSTVFASHAERRRAKGKLPPPAGVGRAATELKEAFLGDIDDKYLPTFHSLRLVLRAGVVFLGAYVAVYSALVMADSGLEMLTNRLFAGQPIAFWYAYGTSFDLIPDILLEPLRICLLAVAFRRCLELFWARSHHVDVETTPEDQEAT
ncbi:hypothetical protein MLP_00090 [Microlunatus phosphovorus NM-1]|uniref:Uncharacterized protein n=1 Tax=Microlunatus phosphovorus (strain ATCC 700054 / DSM 10555 / JCM 9379 / NBRC 101784 / NCIMB 13414 / VKM Ac-1990 / NM-1) TaxID=1032480 RepID=F5XGB6_MICPN|nr:hypothetical protein [Microlunatus phosphovorus]BAK33023.1 hypothetical protein MLP_00090 [Microlunatus phosphovorus NM-1]